VSDWLTTTVGEFVKFNYGKSLPERERDKTGKIPVYGSNGIVGYHTKSLINTPSIIIGRKGTIGSVNYSKIPCWAIDTTFFVTELKEGDLLYAYYLLKSLQLHQYNSDSAVPGLNRDNAHSKLINLPPLSEQKAIAHILGRLDDKIELNQRMNKTLEDIARAIFKSWFIDFDPVRAKMEGRQPEGMSKEVADLFPDSFVDSELGMIPKGWEVNQVNKICNVTRGASPRPIQEYINGTVPWIKIADATASNGCFIFKTKEAIKENGIEKSVIVYPGDLILSNSATCGVPMFVELKGCIHDGWLLFRKFKKVSKNYLYYSLENISQHLVNIADGSVQKNLNTTIVGQQVLVLPPLNFLKNFDSICDNLFSKIKMNSLECFTLINTRDTLLPKLISGEIRIKEAEKIIEKEV
jgi:type I restriction enzyme S subunit